MDQLYTIGKNDLQNFLNELSGIMPKLKEKYEKTLREQAMEDKSNIPGKNILDNIMNYSRSLEVIKKKNDKPVFLIRN